MPTSPLDTLPHAEDADAATAPRDESAASTAKAMLYRYIKTEKITGLSVRSLQDQVLWIRALKELDTRR